MACTLQKLVPSADHAGRFRFPEPGHLEQLLSTPETTLGLLLNSETVLLLDAVHAWLLDVEWKKELKAHPVCLTLKLLVPRLCARATLAPRCICINAIAQRPSWRPPRGLKARHITCDGCAGAAHGVQAVADRQDGRPLPA